MQLTRERLAELRRIAEAAPGPWEWRMSKDGRILDLITLETGYNEEILTPSHINAWLQVKGGLRDFIPAFDPTTALELLDALAAARTEAERWQAELVAAREVVEAARPIANFISHRRVVHAAYNIRGDMLRGRVYALAGHPCALASWTTHKARLAAASSRGLLVPRRAGDRGFA